MSDYAHLTADERDRLAALKADGLSLRAIARAIGRAASTISRELRRNALDSGAVDSTVKCNGSSKPDPDVPATLGEERLDQGSPAKAETALTELVATYPDTAPKLAAWLEQSVPEGLAVFALPEHHRWRMRTSNPMERAVQQELKRRTVKVRVFPGDNALERLVFAILVEIDEKWATDNKAYIHWECQDA